MVRQRMTIKIANLFLNIPFAAFCHIQCIPNNKTAANLLKYLFIPTYKTRV